MELKKFCSAPFSTLIINADGKVGCCREKGTEHVVGDAFTQTIEEIWNGEAIKAWRREFLTGNIETCKKEQHDMSCNLFKHNLEVLPYIEFDEVQNGPVLRLSPDFNGRCNLKCPMCIVWKKPNGKYDLIPNFWENLEANVIPHLKIMDPLSGEPFIQSDLYKIIRMTAKVNPKCRWNFTTNAQWELTNEIKNDLDLIEIDLISVSVDSVNPDTYRKIRKGGEFQDLKRNLVKLKDYVEERKKNGRGETKLMLNFTMQNDNAHELKSIFDFCNWINLNPMILFLYDPSEFSVEQWSDKEKKDLLQNYFTTLDKKYLVLSNRFFNAVIRSMKNEDLRKKMNLLYAAMTEGESLIIQKTAEEPLDYLQSIYEKIKPI